MLDQRGDTVGPVLDPELLDHSFLRRPHRDIVELLGPVILLIVLIWLVMGGRAGITAADD